MRESGGFSECGMAFGAKVEGGTGYGCICMCRYDGIVWGLRFVVWFSLKVLLLISILKEKQKAIPAIRAHRLRLSFIINMNMKL
jgi:hypothetical protein